MFQVMSRTNPLFSRTLISYTLLANLCITCTQKNTIATHSYTRPGHGDQPCGLELMAGGMPKAVNNMSRILQVRGYWSAAVALPQGT